MKVALGIVDNLMADVVIHRDLVAAAALLHDITKTRSLETRERHDESGAELLRELGFDRVAEVVASHVFFRGYNPSGPLEEREIVYYADKRVMHDTIVTVDERVRDLVNRYGRTPEHVERILENGSFILEMEQKIRRYMQTDLETVIRSVM
jgi:putative nucleotidyltransferase with HDIG domain